MELDDEVCLCFHVTKRKIINYLRVHRPRVASQLSECGGAGTGCGWCIPFLKKLHRQSQETLEKGDELPSPEEYQAARRQYIAAGKGTPPPGA